jgi:dCTP deaminase
MEATAGGAVDDEGRRRAMTRVLERVERAPRGVRGARANRGTDARRDARGDQAQRAVDARRNARGVHVKGAAEARGGGEAARSAGRLLVDREIREYVRRYRMLEPFEEQLKRDGVISYGLSSMGYDIRVTDQFKVFTNVYQAVVDPKQFDPSSFVDIQAPICVIPPNSFALARSVEYFRMPRSVLALCLGKSSYARCGIVVNITPLEPGWEGHLTIEISNTTPLPARIYSFEGIAQVLFFEAGAEPDVTYADRKGKYQGQQGITLPKV